jgi:hypothetical protein
MQRPKRVGNREAKIKCRLDKETKRKEQNQNNWKVIECKRKEANTRARKVREDSLFKQIDMIDILNKEQLSNLNEF